MTTEILSLTVNDSQGALLRVLGTIERRGWKVVGIGTTRGPGEAMALEIEVTRLPWHSASVDVLRRHLEKLVCVTAMGEKPQVRLAAGPHPVTADKPLSMGAASCA